LKSRSRAKAKKEGMLALSLAACGQRGQKIKEKKSREGETRGRCTQTTLLLSINVYSVCIFAQPSLHIKLQNYDN